MLISQPLSAISYSRFFKAEWLETQPSIARFYRWSMIEIEIYAEIPEREARENHAPRVACSTKASELTAHHHPMPQEADDCRPPYRLLVMRARLIQFRAPDGSEAGSTAPHHQHGSTVHQRRRLLFASCVQTAGDRETSARRVIQLRIGYGNANGLA